ncbi:MAG: hypothetical protein JW715_04595 [Sedimentisphaerales bacterium]|nr:hypothetical protein [Sedimentisphaerales bacterium]
MAAKSHFWILPVLLCCCSVCVRAQTDPNAWEKLNLNSTTIEGATFYYEKSFEPNLPFFEEKYKEFLDRRKKQHVLISKKAQILADINSILGIEDPPVEMQENFRKALIGAFPSFENMTFYLVKQSTTKEFLRSGGELPNFTYDKASDTALYDPQIEISGKDKQNKNFEYVFLISSSDNFEKDTDVNFQILQNLFGDISMDLMIHEIVEMTLLRQVRPTDPYCRWFSDGTANAITYELLKKHAGSEYADGFIKDYDVNDFRDLHKELNLRYWLSGNLCLLVGDMPTETGQRYNYARYVFATYEVQRLIDNYGINCISVIIDEISAKQSRTGNDLLETIKNVTGEDMDARLAAYQSFEQSRQGIEKYATAFNEASKKKDYEQMAFNIFRMHELRLPSQVEQLMYDYKYSATFLFEMGYEKQADQIMENCISFFSNPGFKNGRLAASEAYIFYALDCNKPLKARDAAEEILKDSPYNVQALTIRMYVHLADKQLNEAKELAKKIITLSEDEKSRNYRAASAVLAIDPNLPESEK